MVRILFFLVGTLVFVVGCGWLGVEIVFGYRSKQVNGTVVNVEVTKSTDGDQTTPIVQFTPEGSTERVEIRGWSTSPAPNKGEMVRVLYNPDSPKTARIDTFMQRWFVPVLLIPLGAFFACMSFAVRG